MLSENLQALLAWVIANPNWIGGLLFLVAFFESLVLVGMVVPGAILLFAIGALVATGAYPIWDALLFAVLGAILGDGLSYWLGRHYQRQLSNIWPLSHYPELMVRGEQFFLHHGGKSVALGRFVGPIRAVVPAVAGMMGMSPGRFYFINILSALVWAPAYILPGVVFGATLSIAAEAASKLVAILLLLAGVLLLSLWMLRAIYRLVTPHLSRQVERFYCMLQRHPRWGRWLVGLIDPQLSAFKGLLLWAVLLLFCSAGFGWLLFTLQQSGPLAWDYALWQLLQGLRTPLMDEWMITITHLGDGRVSVPLMGLLVVWLWWRGPRIASGYLLATLLFAITVPLLLKAGLQLPRPGEYGDGWSRYGFPSWHACMAMLLYGSLAILVSHQLKPEQRWLAYGVAMLPIGIMSFSRLYLGVHWLSDVLGGLALAGAWLTVFGIAYRRHVSGVLAWPSMLLVLLLGGGVLWSAHMINGPDSASYRAPMVQASEGLVVEQPLPLQWQADKEDVIRYLLDEGWQPAERHGWLTPLRWLLPSSEAYPPAVLPRRYAGQWDEVRMLRYRWGEWQLLRLWSAPSAVDKPSLWQGEVVRVMSQNVLGLLHLPRSSALTSEISLPLSWPVVGESNGSLNLHNQGVAK